MTGLVGEAGQFCLPDGEWFCVQCTSAGAAMDEQIAFTEQSDVNETAATKPFVEAQNVTRGHDEDGISTVQSNTRSVCASGEGESGT